MMELGSAGLVFLCFVCFWRDFELDCVAPCLEESLLSLAKLRLEEVWKSFTEHTKRVDVWLNESSFFYFKSV